MTKAKMDYLWAPKAEGIVRGILDHIGVTKVGKSDRYPTGVKYDTLVAISDVILTDEKTASMIASEVSALQSRRKVEGRAPTVNSLVSAMGRMSEADLKEAMKKAGLLK